MDPSPLDPAAHDAKPPADAAAPEDRANRRITARPPRFFSGLALEIAVILVIKAVVLVAIWWMWFSAPEARHMQVPAEPVQQRLIETPAVRATPSLQSFTSGTQDHATH
jgi:hypothetical protein